LDTATAAVAVTTLVTEDVMKTGIVAVLGATVIMDVTADVTITGMTVVELSGVTFTAAGVVVAVGVVEDVSPEGMSPEAVVEVELCALDVGDAEPKLLD
jgi:hypothetical protein